MKTHTSQMRLRRALSWIGAAALLLALPVSGLAASDPWVTAKTKISLLTTEGVPATAINVDTVSGRVTLHGTVTSDAEKTKAAQVAQGVEGVKEVRNLLQVVPAGAKKEVAAVDGDIKGNVTKAFRNDPVLKQSDISVQSVNGGVVLLGGKAGDLTTQLRAIQTAAAVPGVRRVASEIQSPNELSGATADPRAAGMAPDTAARNVAASAKSDTRSAGTTMNDAWITAATKMKLMADHDTPALDINVDTQSGVVTLFGIVANEQQRKAAEKDAHGVSGVKSVKNDLQVVPSSRQESVSSNDADVEKAVESRIGNEESLKRADISVEVKNGVARLTGEVPSETDRLTAAIVARSTPGVRSVLQDDLRVKASS